MADRTRDTIGETVKILVTWSLAISNRLSISIVQTLHPFSSRGAEPPFEPEPFDPLR